MWIDCLILMPLAGIGVVAAIVLLVLRAGLEKHDPKRRIFLITSLALFGFAVIVFAVVPAVYLLYIVLTVGPQFVYAAFKSLG